MNAVVLRGPGQSNGLVGLPLRAALSLMVALGSSAACAVNGDASSQRPASSTVMAMRENGRAQLEVSGASLPRYDNTDGSTRSSRVDMTWLPPRRSALGLSVGMTSPDRFSFSAGGPVAGPRFDLGLHWRYTLDSNYRVDVTAWRRLVPPDALELVQMHEPSYGARVEMQIGSKPRNGFVADRGFLGLQLESGARVTLRRSGGKPMIYYRTKF